MVCSWCFSGVFMRQFWLFLSHLLDILLLVVFWHFFRVFTVCGGGFGRLFKEVSPQIWNLFMVICVCVCGDPFGTFIILWCLKSPNVFELGCCSFAHSCLMIMIIIMDNNGGGRLLAVKDVETGSKWVLYLAVNIQFFHQGPRWLDDLKIAAICYALLKHQDQQSLCSWDAPASDFGHPATKNESNIGLAMHSSSFADLTSDFGTKTKTFTQTLVNLVKAQNCKSLQIPFKPIQTIVEATNSLFQHLQVQNFNETKGDQPRARAIKKHWNLQSKSNRMAPLSNTERSPEFPPFSSVKQRTDLRSSRLEAGFGSFSPRKDPKCHHLQP